jgi:lipopolysaccharide/colanic/teichoic acid biosynthesis glycosyltransferase
MATATRRGWWNRTTPAALTAEAVLPDAQRFDRIIHVELMRADRSGATFCLAVFDLGPADPAAPNDEYEFATYLMTRLRATDHAGCMGGRQVGVVLWDTAYDGAEVFVNSLLAGCPLAKRPTAEIYVHPFHRRPKRPDSTHPEPSGVGEAKPLTDLLAKPAPAWKRVIDVAGALFGLVALAPLLALTAVAIKLTSKGPVLFTQKRSGLGGRAFTIYKFRTMCVEAEQIKKDLRKFSEQDGPAFKMKDDPRVTSIGRYLRKTCIDELPQLWNVLQGDMSLVGPRPLPVDESEGCLDWERRRLFITPGLTCIWQLDGKSRVPFKEWMRMDIRYMHGQTLAQDVRLLFRTAKAVVLHRASH